MSGPPAFGRRDRFLLGTVLALLFLGVAAEAHLTDPTPREETAEIPPVAFAIFFLFLSVPFFFALRWVVGRVLVDVPGPRPRWGFLDVLVVFGLSLLLVLGIGLAGALASEVLGLSESNRMLVLLVAQLAAEGLALYAVLLLVLLHRQPLGAIGLTAARLPRLLLGSAIAWFLFSPIFLLVATLVDLLRWVFDRGTEPQDLIRFVQGMEGDGVHLPLLAVIVVTAVFMAPVFEEVLFRGFLYGWLRRRLAPIPAMTLCAGAFTLVHFPLSVWPPIFVLGFFLAYLYERTGSLAAPIAVHFIHNASVMSYVIYLVLAGEAVS